MGRLLAKPRLRTALVGLGLLCAALALIAWPAQSAAAVREGMALCANVVVPSLFPFFVLASLVVELGLSRCLGRLLHPIMAPLFRVNGACAAALALGFVGGYPVGARTAIQLYQQGQCSKTEAERLLAFCNNSGPAFILGAVGAGVFGSGRAGLALYLCHMAASLMVGLLFRFYRPGEGPSSPRRMGERFQTVSFSAAFPRAVTGAMTSSLNICAFILCFSVVVRLLTLSGLLGAAAQLLSSLPPPLTLPPARSRGAGAVLRGVLPHRRQSHRAAVHGRLYAGLGGGIRPSPGAGLSGGQRPVYADLSHGQAAPRRAVRPADGGAGPPAGPHPVRLRLSGPADRGHRRAGRPPRSGPVRRRGLGAVAVLFGSGGISREKSSGKAKKIAL